MAIEDNASIALIPSGYKSGKLYSVIPDSGDGDFTHSRGSTATRVAASGLIETVASGVPRLDYPLIDGVVQDCPALLLEPSRTNLLLRSEEFDNGSWTKSGCTVTANQIVSPDGSQNADFLKENTSTGSHFLFQNIGATSLSQYAISIFAKANGRVLQVFAGGGDISGNPYANFDLENGLLNNNGCDDALMENYGNGWYRCIIIVTSAVTTGFNPIFGCVQSLSSSRAESYTGDNTSGVYLWGSMIEQGSYPTSYIPTSGSIVTRSADVCNGSGTSAEFNDSEGVLFAEIAALADDSTFRFISISDNIDTNRINLQFNTSNELKGFISGVGSFSSDVDIKQSNKAAVNYKSGQNAFWVNGFKVGENSSTSGTTSGLNELAFHLGNNSNPFYGKTKQLMTFKTALTDSELETLTSWDSFTAMAKGQLYTIE